jgi:hypothetical protein
MVYKGASAPFFYEKGYPFTRSLLLEALVLMNQQESAQAWDAQLPTNPVDIKVPGSRNASASFLKYLILIQATLLFSR